MLTGIYEIEPDTYMQQIDFNVKTGRNLLIFGQAGVGKTEMPIAYAVKHNIPYVYWNLSTQEPPDLVGLPTIDSKTMTTVYAPPGYIPVADRFPEPVIVIIDELDKAKPDMQNPLLEVLHLRTLNGKPLNIKAVFATGNLPEENAFSRPVSHALTNRCRVFKLKTSLSAWSAWAIENGVNPLVIGFLSKNPEYLSRPPSSDPTEYCRASPRSWTNSARDVSSLISSGSSVDEQTLCVAGWVGIEPAMKFKVWLECYRVVEPTVDRIVEGKSYDEISKMTLDQRMVCSISAVARIVSIADEMKNKPKRQDRINEVTRNVFKYLDGVPDEFKYASIKMSLSESFIMQNKLIQVEEFMPIYRKLNKIIRAA